ncbi:hypothetical protein RDI58_003291 [Solanum bulbocastanum]|uniref:Uncharacterized protein n=1 Tax=Solanum bulbocastanum TaxID=147425 RepID=A0AAN8UHI4_SOLBU
MYVLNLCFFTLMVLESLCLFPGKNNIFILCSNQLFRDSLLRTNKKTTATEKFFVILCKESSGASTFVIAYIVLADTRQAKDNYWGASLTTKFNATILIDPPYPQRQQLQAWVTENKRTLLLLEEHIQIWISHLRSIG